MNYMQDARQQAHFRAAGLVDIGRQRETNQDEAILSPKIGFFAVSD
ncbi:MAG: serine/threonine-protein phosphatase, partial [Clostridia bacterium]|nr:serine/threonine-protein phosphatase [Clostridia bacterium]